MMVSWSLGLLVLWCGDRQSQLPQISDVNLLQCRAIGLGLNLQLRRLGSQQVVAELM